MSKSLMGIDFGSSETKFAIYDGGSSPKFVSVATPDNLVKNGTITSYDAMADFLKSTYRHEKLGCKRVAAVLSPAIAYTKCTNVPLMTTDQLEINLPYEFRDYITQGKDKYVYDYAVLERVKNEEDGSETIDLMACAALKSDMAAYMDMFKKAGLNLQLLIPEEFALRNLIINSAKLKSQEEPICLVDLGHSITKVHIFKSGRFEVSKYIDASGISVDRAISELKNVDEHIARVMKENNQERIQESDEVKAVYGSIALDIMRALNFYNYENHSSLESAYIFGGGTLNETAVKFIEEESGIVIKPALELLPPGQYNNPDYIKCVCALGAAMQ